MSKREQLEQAIAALEAQRAALGDAVVDAALVPLREKLAALRAQSLETDRQRKQITVLFADVSGFTAISEEMDPEEVGEMMNALWADIDRAITSYDGTIDKHIGDAVMALFGAPVAHESDPENAVRAALAMQETLRAFVVERGFASSEGEGMPGLQMRIGINTGLVVLGQVGTTTEYTAMGGVVNLASRLEHAAPVGGVLISHDTYRHVRGLFEVQPLEPIRVKGVSEPVRVYLVSAVRPRAFRVPTRGVAGVETPTVGREAELRQMQEVFEAVHTGEGDDRTHILTVVGEAGVGKSRLLYEFTNWLDLQTSPLCYFLGRATEDMVSVPYGLIRGVFAFRCEIQDSDSHEVAREKLRREIVEVVGPVGEAQAPFIGHLIGMDFSTDPHLQGILDDAEQIRDRAFHCVSDYFSAVARQRLVILLLEDIHWADGGSLDLIEHLVRDRPALPLMVVCLTRSRLFERRPAWGEDGVNFVRLDLSPLSEVNSRRLVAEILQKAPEIPLGLYDLIVAQAEGNPFYVEEVIKMLIEDGVIEAGAGQWQVRFDHLAAVRVPTTITGVLQARLDRLPGEEQRTLQCASVVGRVFWDDLVCCLRRDVEEGNGAWLAETAEALTILEGRELIFHHDASVFAAANEFIFKHALLRDVTYESVLLALRRAYHARVAEWLIERSGERIGEHAGRIGEHFERAGNRRQAAEWYARAGRQAMKAYAPEMAVSYYRKALALGEGEADLEEAHRIEVYAGLGEVQSWLGRYSEAVEAFAKMLSEAEAIGDARAQARAWNGTATTQMHRGDLRAAVESATRAEGIAAGAAELDLELVKALWMKGWGLFSMGEMQQAMTLAERVAELSARLGDRSRIAYSLNLLGVLHSVSGDYDAAAQNFEQALEIFQSLENRGRAMPLLNNLGVIAEARGDYQAALDCYQQALSVARELGSRDGEMTYLGNLNGVRVRMGDYSQAEAGLRQVIRMAETSGWGALSYIYSHQAEACLGLGKLEEAIEAARRALALGREAESQEDIGSAWRALGRVAARLGEPVTVEGGHDGPSKAYDAATCFAESAETYAKIGIEVERARTLRAWATSEFEKGDREKGEALWQEAKDIFVELGVHLEVQRMARLPGKKDEGR